MPTVLLNLTSTESQKLGDLVRSKFPGAPADNSLVAYTAHTLLMEGIHEHTEALDWQAEAAEVQRHGGPGHRDFAARGPSDPQTQVTLGQGTKGGA